MKKPLVSGLERLLGQTRTQTLTNNAFYKFAVDAVAMNAFSLIYTVNDYFVAGQSFEEAIGTRITAAVGNTITGRPYGVFNDWCRNLFGATGQGKHLRKYAADTVAFAVGQSPLYAGFLVGGACMRGCIESVLQTDTQPLADAFNAIEWDKIRDAAVLLTLVAPALGTPKKITYDVIRDQLGVENKTHAAQSNTSKPL